MTKIKCGVWHVCTFLVWAFTEDSEWGTLDHYGTPAGFFLFWVPLTIIVAVVTSPIWVPCMLFYYLIIRPIQKVAAQPNPCEKPND